MAAHFLSRIPVRCPRGGGTLQAPLCTPPRPVRRRDNAHQGYYKGKRERVTEQKEEQAKPCPSLWSSSTDAMKEGVGRNSGSSSPAPNSPAAPSSSASARPSSSRSLRSPRSHSDASLPASTPADTSLSTSVVERKSNTACLHLLSAKRFRIVNQCSP